MDRPDRRAFEELTSSGHVRQQPGLEGLRGFAVAAVVLFHAGPGWLPGGYLGVSLFFTLSGVVIGTVLLMEIGRTGTLSVGHFFARRARRLYPAAWVVLAAVAVLRIMSTVLSSTAPSDIVASWLQVANWHFLYQGTSYSDLFEGPSAVLHFWSLAIEEQLYLLVGVVTAVIATTSRRPHRLLGLLAGAGAVVSFGIPFAFDLGVDRVYYGTDTRAGEVFVGLVIAAVIADPRRRRRLLDRARPVAVFGAIALGATIVMWRLVPAGSPAIASGLLPLTAVTSCLLVLAALVPGGPVWVLACARPARWLGGISYGLYLVHFPVFVIVGRVDPEPGLVAVVSMIAVSVGLAVLSSRKVEQPVRLGRVRRRQLLAGASVIALVSAVALVVPAPTTEADDILSRIAEAAPAASQQAATVPPAVQTAAPAATSPTPGTATANRSLTAPAAAPATVPAPTAQAPDTTAADDGPAVLGWYGDSVAMSLLFATGRYVAEGPVRFVNLDVEIGCGVAMSPESEAGRCADRLDLAVDRIAPEGAEVAIVMSCQWELMDTRLPGDVDVRSPDDPAYDAFVRAGYVDAVDRLTAAGLDGVVWVACPYQSATVGVDGLAAVYRDARDTARIDHLNGIVEQIADERDDVAVVDLPSYVNPRVNDAELRPDGSHYEWETDTGVAVALAGLAANAVGELR